MKYINLHCKKCYFFTFFLLLKNICINKEFEFVDLKKKCC